MPLASYFIWFDCSVELTHRSRFLSRSFYGSCRESCQIIEGILKDTRFFSTARLKVEMEHPSDKSRQQASSKVLAASATLQALRDWSG